jgi:hypothetical protein
VSKVDKTTQNQENKVSEEAGEVEIVFSDQIEHMGNAAQTIAFLKRENYARLDLKPPLDLENSLTTTSTETGSIINLSS